VRRRGLSVNDSYSLGLRQRFVGPDISNFLAATITWVCTRQVSLHNQGELKSMRAFVQIATMFGMALFPLVSSSASPARPVVASTTISLNAYAQKYSSWVIGRMDFMSAMKATVIKPKLNIHVPFLVVYDARGQIAFYGTDVYENARILASLPQLPQHSEIPSDTLTRDGVFAMLTDFSNVKDIVASNSHYLVYSVVPAGNHVGVGLGTQAAATQALRKRADQANANILEVEINTK
jgi:hypothetical protein